MLKLTLRGIAAHKFRLISTFLAVMLAVSFMSGTLALTDTITKTFNDLFADVNKGTDAYVRGKAKFSARFGGDQRPRLDASLVGTVGGVDGVAEDEGVVQGYAQIIGSNGKALGNPGFGAPTFGGNWSKIDKLNPWVLVAGGRPPAADDEVVIDKKSADTGKLHVGEMIKLQTKTIASFKLVGIARFGTADSPAGASYALFTDTTAQRIVAEPGKFDAVVAVGDAGVSQEELARRITSVLPKDVEALTGKAIVKENQDQIKQGFGFFTIGLLVFVGIAVIVGAFVIYNTFTIIVTQRLREMALLRAIGAERRQVLLAVLLEALLVGVVASAIGLLAGIGMASGLKGLLNVLGFDLPSTGIVLKPATAIISVSVGVVVTLASALVPSIRASRIPPLAALRDVAIERPLRIGIRSAIGSAILITGAVLLELGLRGSAPALVSGGGVVIVFAGIIVLSATFAKPMSRFLGAPVARVRGVTGRLARENASRNPRRTGSTASALTIGMAILAFFMVFSSSITASINKVVDKTFVGDFVVDSGTFGFGGLPTELTTRLSQLPELKAAAPLRIGFAKVAGGSSFITGVDPKQTFTLLDVGILQGSPDQLGANDIAVYEGKAKDKGWKIGTTIPVLFAETGTQQLRITMIYKDRALAGNYLIGLDGYDANFADHLDNQVYVKLADGVSAAKGRAAIDKIARDYPTAKLRDLTEFKKAQSAQFAPVLGLVTVLLLLSIVIASIGIANTVALSVIERTREIGLLRAIGAARKQVRSMIRWEAVIIAVLGTVVGLLIGIGFSYAVISTLKSRGFSVFQVPIPTLVVMVLFSMLLGVLTALRPAGRAAKLNVLEAIATE